MINKNTFSYDDEDFNTLVSVLILEDEEDILQDIQEYVRESTPEYLRKETLLY
jgi:hypothetical protein